MNTTAIDWTRVAEPQADGSDTDVILELASAGRYAPQFSALARKPDGPTLWPTGRTRWLTTVEDTHLPSHDFTTVPADDQYAVSGLKLLDLWPAIREQCSRLLVAVAPLTLLQIPRECRGGGHGCSCGQFRDDFGWIYVTADEAWGFAEGIVHEMAHWKLRGLGIWFEDWTDLILANGFDERYESPVRKDMPRPMGAVLHGQYSYVHVARMTTIAFRAKGALVDGQDRDWLELQLKRITEGQETLQTNARGTLGAGEAFLAGLYEWTARVLSDGHAALDGR